MFATEAAKDALGRRTPTPHFDGAVVDTPAIIEEIQRLQSEVCEGILRACGRINDLHIRLIGPVLPTDEKGNIQQGRRFSEQGQLGQAYHVTCSQRDSVRVLHQLIDLLNEI